MAVKEWHNAKEMVNNNLITSDNVLEFLCDFNGDGQISAEYKKKNNKEQKKQGDVGTLFGQQVMWTIEQAIATQNVELGDPQGEQVVIGNIVKNMQVSDSRILGVGISRLGTTEVNRRRTIRKSLVGDRGLRGVNIAVVGG